jgi:signal transduction histidine kinase
MPGALPFIIGALLAVPWAASFIMESAALDTATKIFWFKFQSVWQAPVVTAVTCFILEYAWPGRWLTRRNLALLSIAPLLAMAVALTDGFLHLAWRGFVVDGFVTPLRTPVNWFFVAYGYGLSIINIIVFVWLFQRSPQHRWPVVVMLTGLVGMRVVYLLVTTQAIQSDLLFGVPPIAIEYLMYAIALFGFRIFDPLPVARQTVIEQAHAGMLVLDSQGKIVSMNPVAEWILGEPAQQAKGKPVRELLPDYPDGPLADPGGIEIELSLPNTHTQGIPEGQEYPPGRTLPEGHSLGRTPGTLRDGAGTARDGVGVGPEVRCYTLAISLLNDWRGLAVGRLLMLHDVTEQKRAQTLIVDQQRALAMLHEREQLARELHDSIGQVLGYAGFQLEVVHDRINDGNSALSAGQVEDVHTHLAEAGNQLTRLISVMEEAHADMREYILNLRLTPSDQKPFFATLRHYLDGFSQNYGIQTEFSVGPGVDEGKFGPEVQMQLFRIIQEALSNARRHAAASCVQVSFEKQDPLVRIHVQDNGQGFDPALAVSDGSSHFGLRIMQERAEQMGGSLRVQSAPGAGTCIEVDVPVSGIDSEQ